MSEQVTNAQILAAILDLKGDMGAVQQGLRANEQHTSHVSGKIDRVAAELKADTRELAGKLDAHVGSAGAHGVAAEQRGRASVFVAVGIVASLLGGCASAIAVAKFIVPKAAVAGRAP